MRILVTGVTGFVGGSVAGVAARLGHDVIGVARSGLAPRAADAARDGAASGPEPRAPADPFPVARVEGDEALVDLCASFAPEAVVHAAGPSSVAASLTAPRDDFEGGVITWLAVLEAVRRSGARPVVLLPSSAAVYGDPALPVGEGAPLRPISPYGFHKLHAELLADEYAACFGLDVVVARLFSVFGPAQRRLLVWELFEQLTGPGEAAWIQGTGHETRDFLHVDDVALAVLAIFEARRAARSIARAERINVASGEEISVLDLAALMKDALGSTKPVLCRGLERPGDPRRWQADVTRLHALMAPSRPRSPRSTLPECIAAWRAAQSA